MADKEEGPWVSVDSGGVSPRGGATIDNTGMHLVHMELSVVSMRLAGVTRVVGLPPGAVRLEGATMTFVPEHDVVSLLRDRDELVAALDRRMANCRCARGWLVACSMCSEHADLLDRVRAGR